MQEPLEGVSVKYYYLFTTYALRQFTNEMLHRVALLTARFSIYSRCEIKKDSAYDATPVST